MEQIKVKITQSVTALNGGLFISPGYGIHPTRSIESWELIFVRSGTLHMFEEDRQFQVGPGNSLILFPRKTHGGVADYQRDLSFYWVHFCVGTTDSASDQAVLSIPQRTSLRNLDRMSELFRFFLAIQQEGHPDPIQASLIIQLMLAEIAISHRTVEAGTFPLVEKALTFIRMHYQRDISAAGIAQSVQCNPDYLGRIFKISTGKTLTEEVNQQRINRACRLLMDTTLHIDEIAVECGFHDPAYFRRVFRRTNGMTPNAYRKLYSKVHVNIR